MPRLIPRFFTLLVVGFSLLGPSTTTASANAAKNNSKRPNVLFLFTDDQRADTVSALGNPHISTPNIDRLVKSGLVFNNAYCMGSTRPAVCFPSRTMLLSGRSLFHLKNRTAAAPNFARAMTNAGYVTYHHGKRGNTPRDIHPDFRFTHYLKDREERSSGFPGKTIADDAVQFLKNHKGEKPFFLYLAFAGPHDPRVANDEALAKYDVAKMPLPENYLPVHPFDNGEMTIRDEKLAPWPRTRQIVREHLRDYYAVISHMDTQIGRILKALKDSGRYDNTLIIFSSDHGLAVGSHGLMGKQNLYEHSMKSPLVFTGPGIPQGKSTDAYAYLFDIYPTVCDLVGADVGGPIDGKSLAPVIHAKQSSVRDTIFTAYREVQRAVRNDRWKLIRYPQINHSQLFDLKTDPHEVTDLGDNPAHAPKVRELMTLLATSQKETGDTLPLTSKNPKAATFHPPTTKSK